MSIKTVLVTGAGGYVGQRLCRHLVNNSYITNGVVRNTVENIDKVNYVSIDLESTDDYTDLCQNIDCVIHLAGRAHVLKETATNPLELFRQANTVVSTKLARHAIAMGVKRFIFISSIGVNGTFTGENEVFSEISTPKPSTNYAISKYETEESLKALFDDSTTELIIIRLPLVYSAEAPGNFRRLMELVKKKTPLPFGFLDNQRSSIAVENLVDFIGCCIAAKIDHFELFLISDGTDVSTAKITKYLAKGMGASLFLLPSCKFLWHIILPLVGKRGLYEQLFCSLKIDSSKAQKQLGWTPPVKPEEALFVAGKDYR